MLIKPPGAQLDYTANWDDGYLDTGENLSNSSWTIVPTGLTTVSDTFGNKTASIVISGGTHGVTYKLKNTVVTNNAPTRTDTRTIFVRVWGPVS